jgi:hypothetical protein
VHNFRNGVSKIIQVGSSSTFVVVQPNNNVWRLELGSDLCESLLRLKNPPAVKKTRKAGRAPIELDGEIKVFPEFDLEALAYLIEDEGVGCKDPCT